MTVVTLRTVTTIISLLCLETKKTLLTMASLEEKLALSKKMTKAVQQKQPSQSANSYTMNESEYLMTDPRQETPKPYNAEEDLKRLQNGLPKDLSKCKLPQSILESICKNPLNGLSVDPNMDTFTKNLGESLGLSQSASLIEKLERQNNPTQSTAPTTPKKETTSSIDYDKIRQIVEEVVDKKINELNKTSKQEGDVKIVKFGSDNFMLLDSDDNVYECVMKYKGKNKKRKS